MNQVLIAAYFRAFNAGDWEGMLSLVTDDVVHDLNQGGREVGKDALRAHLRQMGRCYHEEIVDLEVMSSDDGRRAAAEYTVLGTYINTDGDQPQARCQVYRLPAGAFFALRDGRIARITSYHNQQDWLHQIEEAA